MRWGRILILGLGAFLIGWGVSEFMRSGYLQHWQRLPDSPSTLSGFAAACDFGVLAKAVDGSLLRCTPIIGECWVRDSGCDKGYDTITRACEFSSPAFSLLAGPPKGVQACIQGTTQYPEAAKTTDYLLDAEGNVWEWSCGLYACGPTWIRYLPCAYGVLGVALGLIWLLVSRKPSVTTSRRL